MQVATIAVSNNNPIPITVNLNVFYEGNICVFEFKDDIDTVQIDAGKTIEISFLPMRINTVNPMYKVRIIVG